MISTVLDRCSSINDNSIVAIIILVIMPAEKPYNQIKQSQMSNHNPSDGLQINIKVKSPAEGNLSPTFGGSVSKNQLNEAMEKVGKHGKSHHLYMKVMGQHKPAAEMRKISLAELAEHTKPESAWLSLNGIVYDVSVYLHYHPGGDIILKGCGKDATNLFYQYHPWVNAKHLLQNYAIGYLSQH